MSDAKDIDTLLAQANHYVDPATGAVVPPIQPSTTFARDENYAVPGAYTYSRDQNPTYTDVERLVARLDGGTEARVFASGMAAITAVLETVNSGEHIAAPQVMYHGTQDWMRRISTKRGIGLTFFDARDPDGLESAVVPGKTSMLWIESPANPTWDVIDIARSAKAAHAAGACLVVDSTVAPPVTSQPLQHGADLVFHSATKYFNGHSDITAGLLVTRECDARWEEIKLVRKLQGGVLGAFESWLLLRGMRTLAVRFERASTTALAIARHFANHRSLDAVLYPGLESHPGHAIAARQMTGGFGGMLSLLVHGDYTQTQAVATRMRVFLRATSLGGVESLVEHRAAIEGPHSKVPKNLLRLSIGLESPRDLIEDIEQALSGD